MLWLDSKTQQISELQFYKFPTPQSFFMLEDKIQKSSDNLFWFSIGSNVMEQRSGDGWFFAWAKNPHGRYMEKIFQILRCWTGRLLLLLTRSSRNSQFKKKVSLEEQKGQKEDRFLRGRQIAFMTYNYFRVTAHDTVLDYADLFSVTFHDGNIQEIDTRWDEVLLFMSKIPSDDVLESLYKLRARQSAQLKTVLELYDMEISQKMSMPNYQKLKNHGEEECRSETSITTLWR